MNWSVDFSERMERSRKPFFLQHAAPVTLGACKAELRYATTRR